VRISDISVSRKHAQIRLEKGNFYIQDLDSKFGTLVQIKKPVILEEKSSKCIQFSRTIVHFSHKQNWGVLSACLRCKCFGDKTVPKSDSSLKAPDENRTIVVEDLRSRRLHIENIPESINLGGHSDEAESNLHPQTPNPHGNIVVPFHSGFEDVIEEYQMDR
jgi:hypothetical protein